MDKNNAKGISEKILNLESKKEFFEAAQLSEICGDWERAAKNYMLSDSIPDAERMKLNQMNIPETISGFESKKEFFEAAQLSEICGDWERAAKNYGLFGSTPDVERILKIQKKLEHEQTYEVQTEIEYEKSFIPNFENANEYKKNHDWLNAAKCYFTAGLLSESSKMYELCARDCDDLKKSAEFLENAANVLNDEQYTPDDVHFWAGLYVRAAKLYKEIGMKEKEQVMLSNAMWVYDYCEFEVDEEII